MTAATTPMMATAATPAITYGVFDFGGGGRREVELVPAPLVGLVVVVEATAAPERDVVGLPDLRGAGVAAPAAEAVTSAQGSANSSPAPAVAAAPWLASAAMAAASACAKQAWQMTTPFWS